MRCHMHALEDEQHFLFDCSLFAAVREQHRFLFGHNQGSIRSLVERNADQMHSVARNAHLCFHAQVSVVMMSGESRLAPGTVNDIG